MGKKKFVDKKTSETYRIVHRSKRDPSLDFQQAPDRVLQPISAKPPEKITVDEELFGKEVEETQEQIEFVEEEIDPDILRALNEEGDEEGAFEELPDNFVLIANYSKPKPKKHSSKHEEDDSEDEEDDELMLGRDTRTMTEQRSILEERFEHIMKEYEEEDDEEEFSDSEEAPASNIHQFSDVLDEFLASTTKQTYKNNPAVLAHQKQPKPQPSKSSDDSELIEIEDFSEEEQWDCESIISTRSNLNNHPVLIAEPKVEKIKLSNKTGMPLGVLSSTRSKSNRSNSDAPAVNKGVPRPKAETKEEKKARKQQIKQERREKRAVKKAVKEAFKQEMLSHSHPSATLIKLE